MRFNLASNPAKFARIATALGGDAAGHTEGEAAEAAVEAVVNLSAEIGIVARLRDLGIPEEAIDGMAAAAMKVTRLLNNNPREVNEDDARRIYCDAY
jgi:alcohol dehydrogenase class IV